MTDITPNQSPKPRRRPAFYSLLAIGIAVLFVVQVISMNFAFRANDDFLYGEVVKGPNPVAGFISITLLYIGFYALPIIYIAILYCVVLSIKRKHKLLNLSICVFAFCLVFFIAHPVFFTTYERVRSSGERWCPRNVQCISYRLREYTTKHENTLPNVENWCEKLLGKDWSFCLKCPCANTPEGMSSYALNKNVMGMKLSELPNNIVILFETKAAKNPVGGKELITADNHKGKGGMVLFADMHIAFVRAEDFNNLRWKP
ncbi:MAG: hypothetical protein ABSB11_00970 [Sedimentisphaerales bacterium]|jgi:hypothetical protein